MSELIPIDKTTQTERIDPNDRIIELGQWCWRLHPDDKERKEWFGCITHVGSNYVHVQSLGYSHIRVHFDEIDEYLRFESDPKSVIGNSIAHHKRRVRDLMEEIKKVTARLGVSNRTAIGVKGEDEGHTTALANISGAVDINKHKAELVNAKDKELPELFKQIREENEELSIWMKAELLPMKAETDLMKGSIGQIEDRIFNVSLYAGLTEDVKKVRKGETAEFHDKLHLMQRRLYMDEECLLGYKTGGLEFNDIGQFDKWLSEDKNFNRIFPFPRCMVAMRVRRKNKDRPWGGDPGDAYIRFQLEKSDKRTFLYIRNGEQLYRMECDLEFGEMLFPGQGEFRPNDPMMANVGSFGDVKDIITERDYDSRIKERKVKRDACAKWNKDNPIEEFRKTLSTEELDHGDRRVAWLWDNANPHRYWKSVINPNDWEPFSPESVYYVECVKELSDRIKHHNLSTSRRHFRI